MFRILFVLYLPLMLAPIPVGAASKKVERKPAIKVVEPKLADNYATADFGYTLEIKVKSTAKAAPSKKK